MIKKDLAFFLFIIFSVIVLAVNIALLVICGLAKMKIKKRTKLKSSALE